MHCQCVHSNGYYCMLFSFLCSILYVWIGVSSLCCSGRMTALITSRLLLLTSGFCIHFICIPKIWRNCGDLFILSSLVLVSQKKTVGKLTVSRQNLAKPFKCCVPVFIMICILNRRSDIIWSF